MNCGGRGWRSGGHIQAAGARRRSRAGGAVRSRREETADLLKIVLQRSERRLRARKISRLQVLRQRAECLHDRIALLGGRGGRLRAFRVMMVAMMPADLLAGRLLQILLKVREVLLRPLQVSGLEVLPQLGESLQHRVLVSGRGCVRDRGGAWTSARKILRQCGEIGLRLRQIAGLQILPQLLKFSPDLLESWTGYSGCSAYSEPRPRKTNCC